MLAICAFLPCLVADGSAAAPGSQAKSAQSQGPPVKALGINTAPITVEVFSDYQCPACGVLFLQTLKPMIDEYVKTGKVYLVHRHFPLPEHPYARQAACYATAAASIGCFERVCCALFEKQTLWSPSGKIDDALSSVLTSSELKRVRELAREAQTDSFVQRDLDAGVKSGIRQTPTMILRHRLRSYPITGTVTYSVLRRFIDDLLAK